MVMLIYMDPTDPEFPVAVGPFPDHDTAFEYGAALWDARGLFWTTEMEAPQHGIR